MFAAEPLLPSVASVELGVEPDGRVSSNKFKDEVSKTLTLAITENGKDSYAPTP